MLSSCRHQQHCILKRHEVAKFTCHSHQRAKQLVVRVHNIHSTILPPKPTTYDALPHPRKNMSATVTNLLNKILVHVNITNFVFNARKKKKKKVVCFDPYKKFHLQTKFIIQFQFLTRYLTFTLLLDEIHVVTILTIIFK